MLHPTRFALAIALLSALAPSLRAQTTVRLSHTPQGGQLAYNWRVSSYENPLSVTPDGRYLVFWSPLVGLLSTAQLTRLELATGEHVKLDVDLLPVFGYPTAATISDDGLRAAFSASFSAYVRDLASGQTTLLSVDSSGQQVYGYYQAPQISGDGRFVTFATGAALVPQDTNDFTDVYVLDLQAGTAQLVTTTQLTYAFSSNASISRDGRYVAFQSNASDLVAGDTNNATDVFLFDRPAQTTVRVNVRPGGAESSGAWGPQISADGRCVVFLSDDAGLVPGDANGVVDVFVAELASGNVRRVSVGSAGQEADEFCDEPRISPDGDLVVFRSAAGTLVPGDTNQAEDLFSHHLVTGVTQRITLAHDGSESTPPFLANFSTLSPGALTDDDATFFFFAKAGDLVPADTNQAFDLFLRSERLPAFYDVYCTAKLNAAGCQPTIGIAGLPSASSTAPFFVTAENVLDYAAASGHLFWGLAPKAVPFKGGTLCVQGPLKRTPLQAPAASPSAPCDAAFATPFALTVPAGTTICAQYWSHDLGAPIPVGLSNAVRFTVLP